MASEQPAVIHMQAGADYLAALQKLGLDPECLFWAEDEVVGHPVLVLVTRQFDRAGPLSLSRLLFKAYNAAATPREIDPFVLRLHSPEQALIREMVGVGMGEFIRNPPSVVTAPIMHPGHQPKREDAVSADVFLSAGGMRFKPAWVYKWSIPSKKPSAVVMSRQWHRFTENVDRLAA